MSPGISYDKLRTAERFAALRKYCEQEAHIDPYDFHCSLEPTCRDSAGKDLVKGGFAHVGEEYDVLIDEREFRLLFVGIDYAKAGLCDRRRIIQNYEDTLNRHYAGIVKMLMEIYQVSCGSEADSEVWKPWLKRMAQTNSTRCCAPSGDKMKAGSSYWMRRNCWQHLRKEIGLLEPTIIVFHGKDLKNSFLHSLGEDHIRVDPFQNVPSALSDICMEIDWGSFSSVALFFHHPAYGHLGHQWHPTVLPAFEYLRSLQRLPGLKQDWISGAREDWPGI